MRKKLIRLTESDLHKIVTESVMKVIGEGESYVDWMIRNRKERFNKTKLKQILDVLGLKSGEYAISGDLGYEKNSRKPTALAVG